MPGYDSTARLPFATGGRVGARHGKYVRTPVPHADISKYMANKKEESKRKRDEFSTMKVPKKKKSPGPQAGAGRAPAKAGGDGKWIQKVNASIKRRGTKGKCTPITKPGCTGRAKALAKTFKKMAAKRKAS
jgi:hypothetical protein